MDENFDFFLQEFGPAFDCREVPSASTKQWRGKLPDQLLAYWEAYGWCGYAEGLFWTVDPSEYGSVAAAWLQGTSYARHDTYHIIARGGFGELYFWGEKTGCSLTIVAADALALPSRDRGPDLEKAMRIFFSSKNRGANDMSDVEGEFLFHRALKKLGRLAQDEMYGFVPALALGGPAALDHLQKVKAVEHLVFLAQLTELRESRLLML